MKLKNQFHFRFGDDTTDVSNIAQISVVLRYIHDCQILERFIGFCDVSSDRRAPAIADIMRQYLSNMNCSDKLVAQAYDGASASAGQYAGVQTIIKSTNPEAIFVHCYAHVLNLVL
ncbi:hypothetical protein AVEN_117347-1 [Araneus ventricosus]|uniref:Uncharacterized protein n=1 Tax=Araneus ventricosus TaxID=182803 RepID=A0A4Y2HYN8_ARAVE|nr:hypothetical protein AVEN_117347-1 [Araneus ventricosus]